MRSTKALASMLAVAAIGTGGWVAPAGAASTHWSKTKCQTWEHRSLKRDPHAPKARKATRC